MHRDIDCENTTEYDLYLEIEALKVTRYFGLIYLESFQIRSRNQNLPNFCSSCPLNLSEDLSDRSSANFSVSKINHPSLNALEPTYDFWRVRRWQFLLSRIVPSPRRLITCQLLSAAQGMPSISAAITGKLKGKSVLPEISAGSLWLSFKSVFGLNGQPHSRVRDVAQVTSCSMSRPISSTNFRSIFQRSSFEIIIIARFRYSLNVSRTIEEYVTNKRIANLFTREFSDNGVELQTRLCSVY